MTKERTGTTLLLWRKLLRAAAVLGAVLAAGTAAYWHIGGGRYSLVDCLYMTVITVTTIGYGEIVDLSGSPGGRIFTMVLAFSGAGLMTYVLVAATSLVVEGTLNKAFRRRRMDREIDRLMGHFIVCGLTGTGRFILEELRATGRRTVLVDHDGERLEREMGREEGLLFLAGDAADGGTLEQAGIGRAEGLFAATADDNLNLVITLTAKGLNPRLRVVARCEQPRNAEKMRQVGADAVVSPARIGGLRMASEMIRPTVVSFLDTMLRQEEESLRIEEWTVPPRLAGSPLSALGLQQYRSLLVLAVKIGGRWEPNPPRTYRLREGDTLVIMTTAEERERLERALPPAT